MREGFSRKFEKLKMLSDDHIRTIHSGTIDILENTGIKVESERALKIFEEHGCNVDFEKEIVKIPDKVIEESINSCPDQFLIRSRDLENNLQIGSNTLFFENSIGMKTIDINTWEPLTPTMFDQDKGIILLDSLKTVDLLNTCGPYSEIDEIPLNMVLLKTLVSKLRNSTKCISVSHYNNSEIFAIEIAKVMGIDLVGTVTATSPLAYNKSAVEAMIRFAEAGFPVSIGSGAVMGGTGPATIAGSTITNNAELLAGLVLVQLVKPGTGVIVNDSVYPMDMRNALPSFGSLGAALHNVIFNQIWQSYNIPTGSWIAGITSSKKIDFQNAYERSMTTLLCALSGSNVISLHGAVYGELTWHPLQAILDDDIAEWVGRTLEGVNVNDETLAIELIKEVGHAPGNYMAKRHTLEWWKKEQFIPKYTDRMPYPNWLNNGKKDALMLAKEKFDQILASHKAIPLTFEQDKEIEKILKSARKYYKHHNDI